MDITHMRMSCRTPPLPPFHLWVLNFEFVSSVSCVLESGVLTPVVDTRYGVKNYATFLTVSVEGLPLESVLKWNRPRQDTPSSVLGNPQLLISAKRPLGGPFSGLSSTSLPSVFFRFWFRLLVFPTKSFLCPASCVLCPVGFLIKHALQPAIQSASR